MNFVDPATEAFDDHALGASVSHGHSACHHQVPLGVEPMEPVMIKLFQR